MPTDEQLREQFEERMRWHRRLVETGGYADDLVNGARLDTQRRAEIDRLDTALKARDAEVQALREALVVARDELRWANSGLNAVPSFQRAIKQADAALAGGETGETAVARAEVEQVPK